jgi:hypothetical protein
MADKGDKPSTTLPATVEKIITSPFRDEPEKAQINVEGADPLYREIRIENKLMDENGEEVKLKPGAEVEVTIAADEHGITPKKKDKHDAA